MINRYPELRPELKTGDILLFRGRGITSWAIERTGWPSHIGMVVKAEDVDVLFCWESTTLNNVVDADTGEKWNGVQLDLLSERVNKMNGDIVVRELLNPIGPQTIKKLLSRRKQLRGKPYKKHLWTLIS